APRHAAERDPVGRDLQCADHRVPDPARAQRRALPRARRGCAAAAQSADLRRDRADRAVRRHQADRLGASVVRLGLIVYKTINGNCSMYKLISTVSLLLAAPLACAADAAASDDCSNGFLGRLAAAYREDANPAPADPNAPAPARRAMESPFSSPPFPSAE